ncbi:MAG: HAD hydrolase family protein [Crocinitomicaceae bacterium]|nr:HAD hydrolase family protein [Crocinitomicaceae bacterium]
MSLLEKNLNALLQSNGMEKVAILNRYQVSDYYQLTLAQLNQLCTELNCSLENLLLFPQFVERERLRKIKLLILDVDGVMTDAGMFFTESGDQIKKYNAKDGMAIMALTKSDFQVGIISSGYKLEMVKARADLLRIQHLYVGRDPKMTILMDWCSTMGISLDEVAIIGDDINDLDVIQNVGFSACPSDAVSKIKRQVDLVLQAKGGKGCVREFIDQYLLDQPV